MQQLNKARAKQRDLTEPLVAAGGRRDPCLRKGTRVTALGEGSGSGRQPSLPELKHQHTAHGHRTETCSDLGGEKQSPSPRLPASLLDRSKFHFLYNFKDLTEALLAFKEWVSDCSFSNFLYYFLNHFFKIFFPPTELLDYLFSLMWFTVFLSTERTQLAKRFGLPTAAAWPMEPLDNRKVLFHSCIASSSSPATGAGDFICLWQLWCYENWLKLFRKLFYCAQKLSRFFKNLFTP